MKKFTWNQAQKLLSLIDRATLNGGYPLWDSQRPTRKRCWLGTADELEMALLQSSVGDEMRRDWHPFFGRLGRLLAIIARSKAQRVMLCRGPRREWIVVEPGYYYFVWRLRHSRQFARTVTPD